MKFRSLLRAAGAITLASISAMQPAIGAESGPQSAGLPAYTDQQVNQFARALVAATKIKKNARLSMDERQAQTNAAIVEEGLMVPTFVAMVSLFQADSAFKARVQKELTKLRG